MSTERISLADRATVFSSLQRKRNTLREIAEAADAKGREPKPQPAPRNRKRATSEPSGQWAKVSLVLPMPPSANRYWRTYRNVVVVSDEARAYKTGVKESAKEQGAFILSGPVAVYVDVYRSRKAGDLDNRLKVALDALKGVAFEDDAQVVEIHARRFDDKNNGRIEITIETI
jgi:crossover junction endodeoxyribonuclease RusA